MAEDLLAKLERKLELEAERVDGETAARLSDALTDAERELLLYLNAFPPSRSSLLR